VTCVTWGWPAAHGYSVFFPAGEEGDVHGQELELGCCIKHTTSAVKSEYEPMLVCLPTNLTGSTLAGAHLGRVPGEERFQLCVLLYFGGFEPCHWAAC
jgi:hypothetical protein